MGRPCGNNANYTREIKRSKRRLNTLVAEAHKEISLFVADLFKEGHISEIPQTNAILEISDGWEIRRLYGKGDWELFEYYGHEEPLPWHEYESSITILVHTGVLRIETEDGEMIRTESSRPVAIEAGTNFRIIPDEETTGIMIFSPPITRPNGARGS